MQNGKLIAKMLSIVIVSALLQQCGLPPRSISESSNELLIKTYSFRLAKNKYMNFHEVMFLSFLVTNKTRSTINKFKITCTHHTKSGIKVGESSRIIRDEKIFPGISLSFNDYDMGVVSPSTYNTKCIATPLFDVIPLQSPGSQT